jgi:hypothetical protein
VRRTKRSALREERAVPCREGATRVEDMNPF